MKGIVNTRDSLAAVLPTNAAQALLTATQVMHAAGFRVVGDTLVLDADASLPALRCLLARLRRVASNRGHSGDAEFFPLPVGTGGGGTGTSSPYLVSDLPGRASTARWHLFCTGVLFSMRSADVMTQSGEEFSCATGDCVLDKRNTHTVLPVSATGARRS